MDQQEGDDGQRRDALLLRLLKTPPQPRPKRERGEGKPTRKIVKRASGEKRERGERDGKPSPKRKVQSSPKSGSQRGVAPKP